MSDYVLGALSGVAACGLTYLYFWIKNSDKKKASKP